MLKYFKVIWGYKVSMNENRTGVATELLSVIPFPVRCMHFAVY